MRTTRALFLSGAMLLLAAAAGAECESSIGIKGGVDWTKSSFSSDTAGLSAGDSRTGPEAGLAFTGQCAEHFGVSLEALWVRRVTRFTVAPELGLPAIVSDYKVDWIDFPLTAVWLFGEDGATVRPLIFAGPDFSTRLRARSENVSGGASGEFDVNDQVKRTMFSLLGGAGVRIQIGHRTWFTVDGRYVYGLTNISRGSGQEWKTRDVQVLAGFLFGLF